jgi:F-type H+-transporting ATPase subunit a
VGEGYDIYLPAVISIFMFILITNLVSNVPYGFGIFTSAVLCLGLSITVFLGVTILGLEKHHVTWFSFFVPLGTPLALVPALVLIETISYLARSVSLGVRLMANLVGGHILLAVLSGMI